MTRHALVMQVHPDKHAEYERRHRPIWEELTHTLREHGAHDYSIFLHAETSQLFAYVEIEDEARWAAIAQTDVCRRWWAFVADVMETSADSSPRAVELHEVFHVD